MRSLVTELFFLFSMETGILGMVKENKEFFSTILLIIGILVCFFGFKIYRTIFSLLVFTAVTLLSVFLMKGRTDWGTITTIFAVFGTVLGFLAYRWHQLGGIVICALMAGTIVWIYTCSMLFSIIIGIFTSVFMWLFPVIVLCFVTSLWGTNIIRGFDIRIPIINLDGIIVSFIILVAGFTMQMITNRKQTLFEKPYPFKLESFIRKGWKI